MLLLLSGLFSFVHPGLYLSCRGFPHVSGDLCFCPQGDKQNKTTNWGLCVGEQKLSWDDQYQYLYVFLLGLVRLLPVLRANAWPQGSWRERWAQAPGHTRLLMLSLQKETPSLNHPVVLRRKPPVWSSPEDELAVLFHKVQAIGWLCRAGRESENLCLVQSFNYLF